VMMHHSLEHRINIGPRRTLGGWSKPAAAV
jgi:hypothetical protein